MQGVRIRINTCVAKMHSELLVIKSKDWFHARALGNGSTLATRLNVLSECPLFTTCTHDFLVQLSFVCQELVYSKGSTIVQAQEPLKGMYIVIKGEVGLTLHPSTTQKGKNHHHRKKRKQKEKEKEKTSKQISKSIILPSTAPFGLTGILNPPSVERVEGGAPTLSAVTLSNVDAVALTHSCHVLLFPIAEYNLITEDRRYDIMSNVLALYTSRKNQFNILNSNSTTSSAKHFIHAKDSNWLEMARYV